MASKLLRLVSDKNQSLRICKGKSIGNENILSKENVLKEKIRVPANSFFRFGSRCSITRGFSQLLLSRIAIHTTQSHRDYHTTNFLFDKESQVNKSAIKEYDYIIIGAGSAGCVLANRLSANKKNTVNILEAGPNDDFWWIHMPEKFTKIMSEPNHNWSYNTAPQKHLNNRPMFYPRGKVLGGSSSINGTVYIRGHPFDYDRWEKEGASGWSYANCLPYFKRSQSHESGESLYRGGNGPLKVSASKVDGVLHRAWIKAGIQAGYGYTDDFNGYKQEGVGQYNFTVHKGERWSSAKSYLRPAMNNPNLTISTDTLVTKILFDGKKAVGVEMLNKLGQVERKMANKEVILSGGAINSPQVLLLSGVGNGDELKKHSIDVVQHIPGVGHNLLEHPALGVQHRCTKPVAMFSQQKRIQMDLTNWQWHLFKTGLGTTSHLDSGAFIRTEPGISHADLQYHFFPNFLSDHGRKPDSFDGFQAIVVQLRSESKGSITLKSNDPRQHPIIDFNICSQEIDFRCLRNGIKLAREIFTQSAFDEFKGEETFPGPDVQTDSQLDKCITNSCEHLYHATSTCRMGSTNDNEVVVDSQCRVVGLEHLRVVDASVMPSIVSGNTNAPTIMIAEKVSDMILGIPPLPKMENVPVWNPKTPQKQREKD